MIEGRQVADLGEDVDPVRRPGSQIVGRHSHHLEDLVLPEMFAACLQQVPGPLHRRAIGPSRRMGEEQHLNPRFGLVVNEILLRKVEQRSGEGFCTGLGSRGRPVRHSDRRVDARAAIPILSNGVED